MCSRFGTVTRYMHALHTISILTTTTATAAGAAAAVVVVVVVVGYVSTICPVIVTVLYYSRLGRGSPYQSAVSGKENQSAFLALHKLIILLSRHVSHLEYFAGACVATLCF